MFAVLVKNKKDETNKEPLFDYSSPVCLYNAGKFGIPMFLKRDMKIVDSFPHYEFIVNRYINPTIFNEIAEDYDHYPNFVNSSESSYNKSIIPNCELYELYFSGNENTDASITFKDIEKNASSLNPIRCVDFRFYVPSIYEDPQVSILKSEVLDIEYFKGILVFQTKVKCDSVTARINNENVFIRIKCVFNQGKVNIKVSFEKINEKVKMSNSEDLKHMKKHLKLVKVFLIISHLEVDIPIHQAILKILHLID